MICNSILICFEALTKCMLYKLLPLCRYNTSRLVLIEALEHVMVQYLPSVSYVCESVCLTCMHVHVHDTATTISSDDKSILALVCANPSLCYDV